MRPEEVPVDLLNLAVMVRLEYNPDGSREDLARFLADVLPAHEAMVRLTMVATGWEPPAQVEKDMAERDQLIEQIRTIRTLQAMWAKIGDHGLPVERDVFAQVARDLAVVLRRPATDPPAFNPERHEMGPRVVEALFPLGIHVTPDMARTMLAAINWPPATRGEDR